MSIEGLLLSLGITAAALGFVLLPLLRRRRAANAETALATQRDRLVVYYERVLRNVQDLDEDYQTGKLNAGEYEAEREQWVQRGVAALKAMEDSHALVAAAPADTAVLDREIEAAIEAAVGAYRKPSGAPE
ncbi:MAG TPA: hypothetical protein PKX07_22530 [Aggregatilineales bacterium]|jgi:hypothetical protein|nr:hypothetical protein [Aggregatilineales bacterium]